VEYSLLFGDFVEHSYEEIRMAAIDILAGREKTTSIPRMYGELGFYTASVLDSRDKGKNITIHNQSLDLSPEDSDTFLEVFWDLFRQGIITLGVDSYNRDFPHFRVSKHGKKILENQDVYFYHDVSSYEVLIKQQVPNIDDVTLKYLKEAMETFYGNCYLSSSVMLGVASEYTFLKLLETADKSKNSSLTQKAMKGRNISEKFKLFKNKLDQEIMEKIINLDPEVSENLDSNLEGIMNTIRRFRNDSGHPSGKEVSREQCYVNLNLFILYCKTAYQLMDYFIK
jgi:hypothetical protein